MAERHSQDVATISKFSAEIDQRDERLQDLEAECDRLQAEVERVHEKMELECYRTVAAEREKWEVREERMVRQLQRLEADKLLRACTVPVEDCGAVTSVNGEFGSCHESRQLSTETPRRVTIQSPPPRDSMTESPGCATTPSSTGIVSPEPMERISVQPLSVATVEQVGGVPTSPFGGVSMGVSTGVAGGASTRLFTGASTGISTGVLPPGVSAEAVTGATLTSATLLAQQLPPLQKFSGESHGEDGETFQDWKVQFEMVTSICKWDPQMKLANLVTRL